MWCYGCGEFGWSFNVVSSMWAMNNFIPMCDAYGYKKFGNCPKLGYIMLCHYPWKWLSILNLEIWARRLCLLITDNMDYFGCECRTCYFTCVKGSTFKRVVVGRWRWSNMEKPCAQLCTVSSSPCECPNWPIFNQCSCWPMMYVVWAIFKNHYYVDLWSMFSRLAHGMSHATSGRNANWQMVLPSV